MYTVQFTHIESIVVQIAVDVNLASGLERQLHLLREQGYVMTNVYASGRSGIVVLTDLEFYGSSRCSANDIDDLTESKLGDNLFGS